MISAILLAAGQSKRMGSENKLIKKIQNIPLIKYSVKNILDSSVDEVVVVLGYQKEIIEKLIEKNNKIKCVINKDFESGIASSIKKGLNCLSKDNDAFFICLADMPFVNKHIYNKLISFRKKNEIVIPTCNGKQGNPILFSKLMKEKIMNISGDVGAKNIFHLYKNKILYVETKDQSITQDFNTQESFNT